jgi:phage host-nuclease inhibitor protein Gam
MGNALELVATAEKMQAAEPPEVLAYDGDDVERGWQIETLASADWALQRMAECEAEAEEIDRQAAAAIERIRKRAEELKAKAARGAGFFRFKLEQYAETHRAALLGGGKKKSRDFVHGRVGWRQHKGKLVVQDAAALEAWLLAQPVEAGLYRMKVEPEKRALNEHFEKVGEIPPGCTYEPGREEITITASAPEAALAKGES